MIRLIAKALSCISIVAIVVFLTSSLWASPPTSKPIDSHWASLAVLPKGIETDPQTRSDQWWLEMIDLTGEKFWNSLDSGDVKSETKRYVEAFGRYGPAFDLAWGIMDPSLVLVAESESDPWNERPAHSQTVSPYRTFYRALQVGLAEAQVRRFLADPKLLDRYCKLVLYSRMLFGTERDYSTFRYMVKRVHQGFEDGKADTFFWYAREFMVLAYVTDRTDLLQHTTPEELHKRFNTWYFWLTDIYTPAIDHLQPQKDRFVWKYVDTYYNGHVLASLPVPPHPFDDWSGSAPASIRNLETSYNSLGRTWDAREKAWARLKKEGIINDGGAKRN